jgi:hypothetical protein
MLFHLVFLSQLPLLTLWYGVGTGPFWCGSILQLTCSLHCPFSSLFDPLLVNVTFDIAMYCHV